MALQNPNQKKRKDTTLWRSHPKIEPTARNSPITNPFGKESRSAVDQWEGKPISAQTPQAVVDERAKGARWNAGFANNGLSSSYADSPTGPPEIHPANRLHGLVGRDPASHEANTHPLTNPSAPQATHAANGSVPTDDASNAAATPKLNVPFSLNPGAPQSPHGPALTPDQVQHQIVDNVGAGDATRFGGQQVTHPDGTTTTVFSDGSNGNPRTVSANQIKAASKALSRADIGALANPLASDALGHTASSNEMATMRQRWMPTNNASTGLVSPAMQQRFAQSDLAAIASGDWRSALGTAAHNARVEANSGTPRNRRMGEHTLAQLERAASQRVESADQRANTATQEAGATQRTGMQQRGANMRTSATERGASARTAAKLGQPVQVALPGGGLGLMDPRTGKVISVQYAGQPVRSIKPTITQKRTQKLVDQLRADASKALAARQKNQVPGADGQVPAPSPKDMQQILLNQAYVQGYSPQINPKTGQISLNINGQQVLL